MTDANQAGRPNIVLVFMDDMGYGDMGCFGSKSIRTPTMDAIAANGIRFTQMYAAASICTPSRAGLLTGRHPNRVGLSRVLFPRDDEGLGDDERTIADDLRQVGYATCMCGKWHLGCRPQHNPTRHGFDRYFGLLYSNDMAPLGLYRDEDVIEEPADQATLTRRYTDEAIRFVRESGDQPFFVYLAHTMPHIPLHVEEEFRGRSSGGVYGDTIECIDHHLGRLMEALDEADKLDNTLLIVTSDNGPWFEGSTGGFRGRKFDVYEGGIRMPFVAQWPGHISAGSRCDGVASLLDMLPTLRQVAGASLPLDRTLDGLDISEALTGGDLPGRDALYFFRHDHLQAIRAGKWKLHTGFGFDNEDKEMPQLFDMELDPSESYNLAGNHPDVVDDLLAKMDAFRGQLNESADRG